MVEEALKEYNAKGRLHLGLFYRKMKKAPSSIIMVAAMSDERDVCMSTKKSTC